ncbi:MAG: 50S ribosomal protein L25 [candidate division KSB1 bacterium]|nr:50S ribosomal protein L25 [candidate division KSB1 bacterium]MDZ7294931.1 50S ribosomal protein L25 [candidate division KSB1 bacterium]MDZ7379111.1 50S ribosomal protein L25 [candidate division KSB1 bacterium]MDZ7391538.1 50S ribosomal protein L25 [candidate division KSB1 bacterium]
MVTLICEKRDKTGKQAAKQLRRRGMVPGIYYIGGENSVPIAVEEKALRAVLQSDANIVDAQVDGKGVKCVIREVQFDPLRDVPVHVDLLGVRMDQKVSIMVPVRLVGVPQGVKVGGGILQQVLREIEVEALPDELPEHIDVDVSNLSVGESIHVRDIVLERAHILTDPALSVASVTAPTVAREVAEAPAAEALAAEEEAEAGGEKEEQ